MNAAPSMEDAATSPFFTLPTFWVAVALAAFLAILPHLDLLAGSLIPMAQAIIIPLCGVALVAAAGFALAGRWPHGLVLVLGVALTVPVMLLPANGAPGASFNPAAQPAETVTVLMANVQYSQGDITELSKLIATHAVDAVVLLEVEQSYVDQVRAATMPVGTVAQQLPYVSHAVQARGAAGSVILSRWPVNLEFDFSERTLTAQGAYGTDLVIGDGSDNADGAVRLWAAERARSVLVSPEQPVVTVSHPTHPFRLVAVHPWPPIRSMAPSWRAGLAELSAWHSTATDLPLILAGDFNASNGHPAYRELAAGLTDVGQLRGRLPLPTWPVHPWIPQFTALDHILVRDLQPVSWQSFVLSGSDHQGLIAELAFAH